MSRNILLVEPNYKNKFPPVALMKFSTYHKRRGDNVVFLKGDIKSFIIERIADKCIAKMSLVDPEINWKSKRDVIIGFIRTKKREYFDKIEISGLSNELLLENWVTYYKDYYWKKWYTKPEEREWDRIMVTTMFTFYFDITVKTINELKDLLKPGGDFQVGGVLATLQPNEIEKATGIKPHIGLSNKPGDLDDGDEQIIDALPLDYSILDEVSYKYEMSNAYYAYTTRGCIRKCPFCAVKIMEPDYQDYISLKERVDEVDRLYGPQRDLLLMDNNVMASKSFDKIIDEIVECGFGAGATYVEPDKLALSIKNLIDGVNDRAYIRKAQALLIEYLDSIKEKEKSYSIYKTFDDLHVLKYETATKPALIDAYNIIKADYEKTLKNRRPRQRKVDFNQGVDARLFTPHMAQQFARIAISPLRIAFDDLKIKEVYIAALRMSVDAGIKNFSNYLLYNFNDKPSELYTRMEINVLLCDEFNVNIYSFPMKYHPLYGEHSHDRNYIGKHWNKKYIRAIQAVLNSTKGMIGRGTTFFYKAFGNNESEYLTLLEMPDAMIVYRFFFEWLESKGHPLSTANWCRALDKLDESEQQVFYEIIHNDDFVNTKERPHYSEHIDCALKFYINLRNEVAEPTGSLYSLKKEFDDTPRENLQYIKESGAVPVLKKYKAT